MAGNERARTGEPADDAQTDPAGAGGPRVPASSRPLPSSTEIEALLRRLTYCRDEARELNLLLVEYMLGLARYELNATLRQVRTRETD